LEILKVKVNQKIRYMKQSPSWEANSHSATQKKFLTFYEPKDLLLCSQEPTNGLYSELYESSSYLNFLV
jgi:hypothetical protein